MESSRARFAAINPVVTPTRLIAFSSKALCTGLPVARSAVSSAGAADSESDRRKRARVTEENAQKDCVGGPEGRQKTGRTGGDARQGDNEDRHENQAPSAPDVSNGPWSACRRKQKLSETSNDPATCPSCNFKCHPRRFGCVRRRIKFANSSGWSIIAW